MFIQFLSILSIITNVLANSQTTTACQDPLTCYLNSVVIAIPDFCQDLDGKDLCISSFACKGIFIDSIPSSYVAPTTLSFGVNGVGTYCSGDYSYGRTVKGSMTASITETNVDIALLVGKEGEFPVSTEFSTCEIPSMEVDITFSSTVLGDLAPALEAVIVKAVNVLICTKVKNFVAVNVTNALVNVIDPALKVVIDSQPTPLPLYDPHYLSWKDSIVSTIHKLVDVVDGLASGGEFLQCLVNETPTLINDLIEREARKLVQSETHNKIFVDLRSKDIVFPIPAAAHSMISLLPITKPLTATPVSLGAVPQLNSTITLTSFTLEGFDTMNVFEVLEPMAESNVSLHTNIGLDSMKVQIGLELNILSRNDVGEVISYTEELLATFQVHDAFVLADLVIAVNDFVLKSFFLDQLSSPACWLSTLTEFSIANLQLHLAIDELSIVQVEGSAGPIEKDILNLVDNGIKLFTAGFGELVTDTINGIMQGPVRNGVNAKISEALAQAKKDSPCLTHYPYTDSRDYIAWAQSDLIKMVDTIVNDKIGAQGLNKIMNCATNFTGVLALNTSRLHLSVAGLNSFYALKVLAPVEGGDESSQFDLLNQIAMGACPNGFGSADCNPLKLVIASYSDIEDEDTVWAQAVNEIVRHFKIEIELENLDVNLNLLLKIDKNGLRDLTFGQTAVSGCTQSTFDSMAIEGFTIGVSRADVVVNDGQHQRNITSLVSRVLDALTRQDKINERNSNMQNTLAAAGDTCRANGAAVQPDSIDPEYNSNNGNNNEWKWEMAVLVMGCVFCLLGLLWAYKYWGNAKALSCVPELDDSQHGNNGANGARLSLWERLDCSNALIFHHKVPLWLQVAIPVVLVGNMGLFLNSNMIPDAVSVMVEIDTKEKTINPDPVFDFGLASTVHDMWEAKVYPLAILIAFFSGAWPYIKLASMLTAWVLPPGLLSVERRESILTTLDVLGKWSLIDFFVMILMLCAFYFELIIADGDVAELIIKVTVLPKWGFYGFLLATMISLGLGHIILACHRLVTEHKVLPLPEAYSPKESLSSLTYTVYLEEGDEVIASDGSLIRGPVATAVPRRPSSERSGRSTNNAIMNTETAESAVESNSAAVHTPTSPHSPVVQATLRKAMYVKMTSLGTFLVVLMVLATATFVVVGTFLETMRFEFKGLTGAMLKAKSTVDYSFVTVGTSVPEHSGIPNDFAIRWMQGCFFLFGMAMPLAFTLALLVLWVVPLSISAQRQLFVLSEVLNAWSTLDVYSVSIIAALLEIQQFAMFIVGDSCDGINKLLEQIPGLSDDPKCFDVIAVLTNNCWTIFLAAGLLIVVGLPSLSVCHIAIHHRMKQSEDGLFDHIRRHSLALSLDENTLNKNNRVSSKDSAQHAQDTAAELCKPLLLDDVPLEDGATAAPGDHSVASNDMDGSGNGSSLRRRALNQAASAPENAPVTTTAPAPARKSLLARFLASFSTHNSNMFLLRQFCRLRLVEITTVDHSTLYYKQQQLEIQQQRQSQHVAYSDVYAERSTNNIDVSPVKDGHNDTNQNISTEVF